MKKSDYKSYIKDLEQTIESMNEECDEFISEQDNFRNNIDILEIEIYKLEEKYQTSESTITDLIETISKNDKEKITIAYRHKSEINFLEDNIQSFKNLTNKNKEIIETLEADCDNFRVENDKLKKEIHKLKESIVIQEKRLLVSQHVICCNEETIDILRKQNKQDNLRYNNLFKLLENLKG